MSTVFVIGNTHLDRMFHVQEIARPGETVLAHGSSQLVGGKGANQAVAAACSGADSVFVSRVGDDDEANLVLAWLRAVPRLDIARVSRTVGAPTGGAFIQSDASSENAIVVMPGANARISVADIEAVSRVAKKGDLLLLQLEMPLEMMRQAACTFRAHGCSVVLNAAPALDISEILPFVDVLVVNELEAQVTLGSTDRASLAERTRELGIRLVVTRGAQGCECYDASGYLDAVEAESIDVVDTTGAGDAFVGGLAAQLACGTDLVMAARRATHLAALACCSVGAQTYVRALHDRGVIDAGGDPGTEPSMRTMTLEGCN
ncbi:ribokinase [Actinomyces urogenitalis]|uniref:ribokinase n=1 Tax=Actinomyces urogenitalis TaxID=103621 RepID=UPI000660BE71|nr:ribokinase [Actinomyces urogenitalis]MBS6071924.1 ribokinase [Actinomyces urogenitalis]MDK8238055.1 ribokinase [Actinomyces urogenitalis]MDK8835267.1 ribokinase [Actinomyces urogenitalis]MDU5874946.1 ribokinase [Actinomyces urogenitalis]WOO95477.1 ribokinase [Actinomyces urogenitalis]